MADTAVCVVDDRGEVHLLSTALTDPDALLAVLKAFLLRLRRVGREAGSLSPWLHPRLIKLGLPAVCLETQNVRAARVAPSTPPCARRWRTMSRRLHDLVVKFVARDALCRRFMAIPGVGPVTALYAAIPRRAKKRSRRAPG